MTVKSLLVYKLLFNKYKICDDWSFNPFKFSINFRYICKMNKKLKLIAYASILLSFSNLSLADNVINTRFGKVAVTDLGDEKVITINGQRISHQPQHSYLSLDRKLTLGDKDVILIEGVDGTACPAQYYFLAVGKQFSRITDSFGTCSDLIKVQKTNNKITVSMPSYNHISESQKNRRPTRFVYEYDIQSLKENGKIIN